MSVAVSTVEAVEAAVAAVSDPEFSGVSIKDLGILEKVEMRDGTIVIELVPTFLGCPALEVIEADVLAAAESAAAETSVEVRFVTSPTWTPERITTEGRRALAELTVAVRDHRPVVCPVCGTESVAERSAFGTTACRAIGYCSSCRNPIEVVRR